MKTQKLWIHALLFSSLIASQFPLAPNLLILGQPIQA